MRQKSGAATFLSERRSFGEIGAFSLLNELTAWSYWPCYLIALALSVLWNFTRTVLPVTSAKI